MHHNSTYDIWFFSMTVKVTCYVSSGFTFGELSVVLVAYFVRDLVPLQLTLYGPVILLLLPLFYIKESPRWLLNQGKYTQAKTVLMHMAKVNRNMERMACLDQFHQQAPITTDPCSSDTTSQQETKPNILVGIFSSER